MSIFKDRIIRAARLDIRLYEEVEADKGAMGQAMGVVVLSSIAAGIGSTARVGIGGILVGTVIALCLGLSHLLYRHETPSRATDQSRSW